MIKIEYVINSELMSDSQYEDQKTKYFVITEEMISDLIFQNTNNEMVSASEVEIESFYKS